MKKFFILALNILLPMGLSAQLLLPSSNQQMIEQAVQDGLLFVRQEYQLEDTVTHKRYTWDNNPYFGSGLSFCVLTEDGYVTTESMFAPWQMDPNYEQYRESIYCPVLTDTYCRAVGDSTWRKVGSIDPQSEFPLAESVWYEVADTSFGGEGFMVDVSSGKKDGWLVWLTADDEETSLDEAKLSLTVYKSELNFRDGVELYSVKVLTTTEHILGGIYVEPHYTSIGVVKFAIAGLIVNVEGLWSVLKLKGPIASFSCSSVEALTPVDSKNSNSGKKAKK